MAAEADGQCRGRRVKPAFRTAGVGRLLAALLLLSSGLLPSGLLRGGALQGGTLLSPGAGGLSAQGAELTRVDALIAEGSFVEGRTILEGWIDRSWGAASRGEREQGLWLRAVLTIDPALAELDFRRLVVEYPGGSFSDAALLRLAMIARARGDLAGARQYLQILVRDYLESLHRVEARTHLARWEAGDGAPGPSSVSGPRVASPPPQSSAVTETVGDSPSTPPTLPAPPAPAPPPPPPDPPAPPTGSYTVQLGAFSLESYARGLATDPRLSGVDLRIVRVQGNDFVRVRMGTFQSEADARREVERLRSLGVDAMVSTDRDREVPIR